MAGNQEERNHGCHVEPIASYFMTFQTFSFIAALFINGTQVGSDIGYHEKACKILLPIQKSLNTSI